MPVRYWHPMRHSFGTHAALFGVNPWRLQAWLGHKRIDETMRYVHVAESHRRELPETIRAYMSEPDPDARIIKMLGARGPKFAKTEAPEIESQRDIVRLGRSGGGSRTPDPAVNSRLLYH